MYRKAYGISAVGLADPEYRECYHPVKLGASPVGIMSVLVRRDSIDQRRLFHVLNWSPNTWSLNPLGDEDERVVLVRGKAPLFRRVTRRDRKLPPVLNKAGQPNPEGLDDVVLCALARLA